MGIFGRFLWSARISVASTALRLTFWIKCAIMAVTTCECGKDFVVALTSLEIVSEVFKKEVNIMDELQMIVNEFEAKKAEAAVDKMYIGMLQSENVVGVTAALLLTKRSGRIKHDEFYASDKCNEIGKFTYKNMEVNTIKYDGGGASVEVSVYLNGERQIVYSHDGSPSSPRIYRHGEWEKYFTAFAKEAITKELKLRRDQMREQSKKIIDNAQRFRNIEDTKAFR